MVGKNYPAELKDALLAYGAEKIGQFSRIDELVQDAHAADFNLIALFVDSTTVECVMDDAVNTLLGLQQLAKLGCKASIVFVTEQAMAEEIGIAKMVG